MCLSGHSISYKNVNEMPGYLLHIYRILHGSGRIKIIFFNAVNKELKIYDVVNDEVK